MEQLKKVWLSKEWQSAKVLKKQKKHRWHLQGEETCGEVLQQVQVVEGAGEQEGCKDIYER
eukprot:4847125-Amphidinium_carterae.1